EKAIASHVPGATYRLQFNRQFTFAQAAAIADYLRELGITDCYASPLFQAGPQSTHGYDICGFDQFNPHLGSARAFEEWSAHLQRLGLGLVLDMVPNHMGNDLSNSWWLDVLEKGQASPYGSWFDIEWHPLKADLQNKVLLPVLEDHYARVLEAGKLRLVFERGGFAIGYYERQFPVAPHTYSSLLKQVLTRCGQEPQTAVILRNLEALVEALSAWETSGESARSEFAKVKDQLGQWYQQVPDFRRHLEATQTAFNGQAGLPRSFDRLHGLLQQQHYRLAYWRVGPEEINYRRFFDITDLVSLRMELFPVFAATHQLVFRLLREGKITGLRIDHPDGLWDPKQYCQRLQAGFGQLITDSGQAAASSPTPLYVVVEKILTGDEPLPPDWPVAGTTGYDFLNRLNGLFVNGVNAGAFDQLYEEFTGCPPEFEALVNRSKKLILHTSLISELRALTHRLKSLAVSTRYGQDFTFNQLHTALFEIIAAFPVYRTYVTAETTEVSPTDRGYILQAVRAAKDWNGAMDKAVLEFIQNLLLLQPPDDLDATEQARCRDFVLRFQQLTGPVMAKGLEDTAFYNFNRFISLNEVGGDPGKFGV
ncbi:MAG TPA: malto-oligosyltrehalose synthase, partial [Bacillota bacterium]|nr:malto-oligosyltrehalose synthase [Bacillota bacterium]